MSQLLLSETVNIDAFPQISATDHYQIQPGQEITIGDLHANTLKFIFMLVRHGVITNLNTKNYARLVDIYRTPTADLNPSLLTAFNQILDSLQFNPNAIIRLIGDELADRGQNDYFTLKLIEKLKQAQVPLEIILSNHGLEFIEAYETKNIFHPTLLDKLKHAPSLCQLQTLIDRGLVSRDEIIDLANQHYKPCLRVISYTISEDNKNLIIYSHAAIGLNTIQSLAEKFQLKYQANSIRELANSIDAINSHFAKLVKDNQVHTLYSPINLQLGYNGNGDLRHSPIEFVMWNRRNELTYRPQNYQDGKLYFAHGHDMHDIKAEHILILDNLLGKRSDLHQGEYTVVFMHPKDLTTSLAETKKTHLCLATISTQLKAIEQHSKNLRQRGNLTNANLTDVLHQTLSTAFSAFKQQKIDRVTFQTQCLNAINQIQPKLARNNIWTQLLENFILAILGLGAIYLIAGLYHKARTGHFLFFRPKINEKIEKLAHLILSIPE